MPQLISTADLPGMAGQDLEPSTWFEISQDRVNQFADATNDHQFIHIDKDKAAATPFGGTIAHGFLTLSLLTYLLFEHTVMPEGTSMTINYGSDKIRYLAPVRVGKRIRAKQKVLEVNEKKPGQWLLKLAVTVEIEGEQTPALIAEILYMHLTS